MSRQNDKRPLRSLVYISDAKLGDIIDSLDKGTQRSIAAQLTIDFKLLGLTLSSPPPDNSLRNRSRVARLRVAEQYLRQHSQIGDAATGRAWIEGELDMGWKPLPDGKTVLFCGHSGSLLVVLSGPAGDLADYQATGEQASSGHPATIIDAISPGSDMRQFWLDLEGMARDVIVMPQRVRFLARVADRRQPERDAARPGIVLAAPLYVEYADPAAPPPGGNLVRWLRAIAWPTIPRARRRIAGVLITAALIITAAAVTIPVLASHGSQTGSGPGFSRASGAAQAKGSPSAGMSAAASPAATAATGTIPYERILGPGCPQPGGNHIYVGPQDAGHDWTSATATTWPVPGCSNKLLYSTPTTESDRNRWQNYYTWNFADVPTRAACTFVIYIADSPYSEYDTLYYWTTWTTGGSIIVGDQSFLIDQSINRGRWVREGPFTFPTGKAELMITDAGTSSPSGTLTVSVVRLTCT